MSKKQYIGIIILAIMILGFVFYWYEYRPSQIKKDCFAISTLKKDLYPISGDLDDYYKNCLRESGL